MNDYFENLEKLSLSFVDSIRKNSILKENELKMMKSNKFFLNFIDKNENKSFLDYCAENLNLETANALITNGCYMGKDFLIKYIEKENVLFVDFLVKKYPNFLDFNFKSGARGMGPNPLITSVIKGNLELVKILIDSKKCDLNYEASRYGNALSAGIKENKIEIVEYFLRNGIFSLKKKVKKSIDDCLTQDHPPYFCCRHKEMLNFLLDNFPNEIDLNYQKPTPIIDSDFDVTSDFDSSSSFLHILIREDIDLKVLEEMIKICISHNVNLNLRNKYGKNFLDSLQENTKYKGLHQKITEYISDKNKKNQKQDFVKSSKNVVLNKSHENGEKFYNISQTNDKNLEERIISLEEKNKILEKELKDVKEQLKKYSDQTFEIKFLKEEILKLKNSFTFQNNNQRDDIVY